MGRYSETHEQSDCSNFSALLLGFLVISFAPFPSLLSMCTKLKAKGHHIENVAAIAPHSLAEDNVENLTDPVSCHALKNLEWNHHLIIIQVLHFELKK